MMKWINKKKNKNGFTLLELVVVIAILAVLGMIAIPKLDRSRLTSQVAAHNANVRVLKSAGAMYLADNPNAGDGDISGLEEGKAKLEDYLDGDKLPERTVLFKDETGQLKDAKFVVTIVGGNINVEPGELKIEDKEVVKK